MEYKLTFNFLQAKHALPVLGGSLSAPLAEAAVCLPLTVDVVLDELDCARCCCCWWKSPSRKSLSSPLSSVSSLSSLRSRGGRVADGLDPEPLLVEGFEVGMLLGVVQ